MHSDKIKLILISFLALFLELVLIRWYPSHIFSIAFFSNAVLIASFLGLGLGLLLSHKKIEYFDYFPYMIAAAITIIILLRNLGIGIPADAQTWIWSGYYGNRINEVSSLRISISQLAAFIFLLTAAIFIPIGQKIGKLMNAFEPLRAYTLNVFGSLLGVISFAVISFFNAPSYVWFLAVLLIAVLIIPKDNKLIVKIFVIAAAIFVIALIEKDTIWSPYYAINTVKDSNNSVNVYVNQLFHQKAVNFEREPVLYEKYMLAYTWFRPKRVLIIGAGTGNDVWIARKAGVEHIDAVEIDPVILKLGHPQRPYDSDKVKVFIDDARSFMHRDLEKYDMIVYGTLDSHASLSMTSSIRLDNYIYTKEAMEEARHLLKPDGVAVLLFSIPKEWMCIKLLETARIVFGSDSTRYLIRDNYLFNLMVVAGPGVKKACIMRPDLNKQLLPLPPQMETSIPRDDWPYLYLSERTIPRLYLITLLALILISVGAIFILSPLKEGRINPLFFFLGSSFLLLETKSVTTFSLLFGSTWIVNAVVFASILIIALLANKLVMAYNLRESKLFIAGLLLSLIFVYIFPISIFLRLTFPVKILAAGMIIALPILFSSILFAIVIRFTKDMGMAIGSNLLGAVVGGFLEYSSMVLGLNALYIIAFACYLIAAYHIIISEKN